MYLGETVDGRALDAVESFDGSSTSSVSSTDPSAFVTVLLRLK